MASIGIHYETPQKPETPGEPAVRESKYPLHEEGYVSTVGELEFDIDDTKTDIQKFGMWCHKFIIDGIKTKKFEDDSDKQEICNAYALAWIYGRIPKGYTMYVYAIYETIIFQGKANASTWLSTYLWSLKSREYRRVIEYYSINATTLAVLANHLYHRALVPHIIRILQTRKLEDYKGFIRYCYGHIDDAGSPFVGYLIRMLNSDTSTIPGLQKI